MSINTKIGIRIKKLREDKKVSQEQLAHLADVDRSYMSKIENGSVHISINILERIVKALGTTFNVFFEDYD